MAKPTIYVEDTEADVMKPTSYAQILPARLLGIHLQDPAG